MDYALYLGVPGVLFALAIACAVFNSRSLWRFAQGAVSVWLLSQGVEFISFLVRMFLEIHDLMAYLKKEPGALSLIGGAILIQMLQMTPGLVWLYGLRSYFKKNLDRAC